MGLNDDRVRAERAVANLRAAINTAGTRASPDATLTAHAAEANAAAVLLFSTVVNEAVRTLQFKIVPELKKTFGKG